MSQLVRFTRDLDRMFEDEVFMPLMSRARVPAVDLYETDNEVVAEVSIPGLDPKQVSVEIENNILHIRGEEAEVVEDKQRDYYHKEVRRGTFARSMSLPTEVDSDKVTAASEKGILKIVMPKSEKVKPKKIAIEVKE